MTSQHRKSNSQPTKRATSEAQIIESPWLPDKPAFLGLYAETPIWQKFQELSADFQQAAINLLTSLTPVLKDVKFLANSNIDKQTILNGLNDKTVVLQRMQSHHPAPQGFYRLIIDSPMDSSAGQSLQSIDWFIKVVTPSQAERQQQADNTACWLYQQNATTDTCWQTSPLLFKPMAFIDGKLVENNQNKILISRYQAGRFLRPEKSDTMLLAKALAGLHRTLADQPNAEQVRLLGLERQQFIQQRLQSWQSLLKSPENHLHKQLPAELAELILAYEANRLDCLIKDAQPIHGDLNSGNVWLGNDNQLLFLDFEDSLSAWFNPLMDVAYILERLLLVQIEDEAKQLELMQCFLENYLSHNRSLEQSDFSPSIDEKIQLNNQLAADLAGQIPEILQALAIRALVFLVVAAEDSQQAVADEWQKFYFLYQQAGSKQALFNKVQ